MKTQTEVSKAYANTSAASRAARNVLGKKAAIHTDFHLVAKRGGKYAWAAGPDGKARNSKPPRHARKGGAK